MAGYYRFSRPRQLCRHLPRHRVHIRYSRARWCCRNRQTVDKSPGSIWFAAFRSDCFPWLAWAYSAILLWLRRNFWTHPAIACNIPPEVRVLSVRYSSGKQNPKGLSGRMAETERSIPYSRKRQNCLLMTNRLEKRCFSNRYSYRKQNLPMFSNRMAGRGRSVRYSQSIYYSLIINIIWLKR